MTTMVEFGDLFPGRPLHLGELGRDLVASRCGRRACGTCVDAMSAPTAPPTTIVYVGHVVVARLRLEQRQRAGRTSRCRRGDPDADERLAEDVGASMPAAKKPRARSASAPSCVGGIAPRRPARLAARRRASSALTTSASASPPDARDAPRRRFGSIVVGSSSRRRSSSRSSCVRGLVGCVFAGGHRGRSSGPRRARP